VMGLTEMSPNTCVAFFQTIEFDVKSLWFFHPVPRNEKFGHVEQEEPEGMKKGDSRRQCTL
jgi:hypothetical protein